MLSFLNRKVIVESSLDTIEEIFSELGNMSESSSKCNRDVWKFLTQLEDRMGHHVIRVSERENGKKIEGRKYMRR